MTSNPASARRFAHHSAARRLARGFTLIELMVTLAIVAIITSIAYPSYQQQLIKGRRSDAKTALLDLAARQERFFTVNNAYTTDPVALGYGAGSTFPLSVNVSGKAFYTINVSSVTAGTSTVLPAFVAVATPITPQTSDTTCYGYRITGAGVQSNVDSGGAQITGTGCW